MKALAGLLVALAFAAPLRAENLCPRYGECVPADKFACQDVDRSSLVTRVCYNEEKSYMIIRLKQQDYHYCGVDPQTVSDLLTAQSMGRFYNQNIKVGATNGRFDCRLHPVPTF